MNRRRMMLTALAACTAAVLACKPKAERLLFTGQQFNHKGQYSQAVPALEEALTHSAKGKALVRAEIHHELGTARLNLHELDKAEWHFQGALAIFAVELPEDHADAIATRGALATLHDRRGDHEKGEELQRDLLKQSERAFGADSREAGLVWSALAENLHSQRKNEASLRAWLRAEDILETQLSPHDPKMGEIYNGLGNIYYERDDLEKAELFYRRALNIREKALGEGHPHTAMTMFNLSRVFAAKGETTVALEIVKRVQIIRQRRLPRDHPLIHETLEWRAALEALED